MKKITLLLLIALMAATNCPAAQPEHELLQESARAQQTLTNLMPVIDTFVTDLKTGDIDVLEKHLQEHASALDVSPVLRFMQDYGPVLQGLLTQAITQFPVDKLPVDWQKNVLAAQQVALLNMPSLSKFIDNLSALQPSIAALPSSIPALCNALRAIKTTPEFESLKTNVAKLYEETLSPALIAVNTIHFKKIKIALDELVKQQNNKPFKIELIIMGFDEIRRIVPLMINVIAQTTKLAESINGAITLATSNNMLALPTKKDLDSVDEQSATFLKSMQTLQREINKALGK